jgi:sugar phosphate isomerase/epimerase
MTQNIRLLCSTGTISRNPDYTDYQQVLIHASQIHVDGFELMFYPSWYSAIEQIADALCNSGLSFPALHAEKNIGVALGSSNTEEREQGVRWLTENCRLANMLGTQVLILHLWGWPQLDDHLEYNLKPLRQCLDVTAHYDLKLAIETIPGRRADPLSNVHKAIEQDTRCCVALDTEFLAHYDQQDAVFDTAWLWEHERVRHIHIKDFDTQPFSPEGKRRYLHPGEGHIDFTRFFTRLKQSDFSGYVSLESPAIDQNGQVDHAKLNRSLEFIRQLL